MPEGISAEPAAAAENPQRVLQEHGNQIGRTENRSRRQNETIVPIENARWRNRPRLRIDFPAPGMAYEKYDRCGCQCEMPYCPGRHQTVAASLDTVSTRTRVASGQQGHACPVEWIAAYLAG